MGLGAKGSAKYWGCKNPLGVTKVQINLIVQFFF
jgi:hypothetical protein